MKVESFIKLKYHKDNKPTCRLINHTKSNVGQISKKNDRKKMFGIKKNITQWKHTKETIDSTVLQTKQLLFYTNRYKILLSIYYQIYIKQKIKFSNTKHKHLRIRIRHN